MITGFAKLAYSSEVTIAYVLCLYLITVLRMPVCLCHPITTYIQAGDYGMMFVLNHSDFRIGTSSHTSDNIATLLTDASAGQALKICSLWKSVSSNTPYLYQQRMLTTEQLTLPSVVIGNLSHSAPSSILTSRHLSHILFCHSAISILLFNPCIQ